MALFNSERRNSTLFYLHFFHQVCDFPPTFHVLLEEVGAAQVGAPDLVDGQGGVDLLQQSAQHVLVAVLEADVVGDGLQHLEQHFLGSSGQHLEPVIAGLFFATL